MNWEDSPLKEPFDILSKAFLNDSVLIIPVRNNLTIRYAYRSLQLELTHPVPSFNGMKWSILESYKSNEFSWHIMEHKLNSYSEACELIISKIAFYKMEEAIE